MNNATVYNGEPDLAKRLLDIRARFNSKRDLYDYMVNVMVSTLRF